MPIFGKKVLISTESIRIRVSVRIRVKDRVRVKVRFKVNFFGA